MQENNSSTVEFKNHLLINQATGECYETNIEIKKIYNLSIKAKGYRMIYMKKDGAMDKCLLDGCHGIILINVLRDICKEGILKKKQTDYAKEFNMDISTIKRYWVIMKKHGVLKQVKKVTYVNPYVALPYNIKDEDANKLQAHWDSLWYDEV